MPMIWALQRTHQHGCSEACTPPVSRSQSKGQQRLTYERQWNETEIQESKVPAPALSPTGCITSDKSLFLLGLIFPIYKRKALDLPHGPSSSSTQCFQLPAASPWPLQDWQSSWDFPPETDGQRSPWEGLPREQLGSVHFSNGFMKPHSCAYERCM